MRAVIQRVLQASVSVEGEVKTSIGAGMLVLAGFHGDDTVQDMEYIAEKILGLRIFDDEKGVMNRSLRETEGDLLVVSQFTLYGDARKGRRPSYSAAMPPAKASVFFSDFLEICRSKHGKVQAGVFGATMKVSLVNAGPVTILLDSRRQF
jgi:D-tyrosyl-tRNA(Tyr) deacylase